VHKLGHNQQPTLIISATPPAVNSEQPMWVVLLSRYETVGVPSCAFCECGIRQPARWGGHA